MGKLSLQGVTKHFGKTVALQAISLEVQDGEFAVLLGPSGCGKTTLLRCISGLETPEAGDILLEGQRVNDLPPRERDVAMVFQNYALFPLMKVSQNIAFPLKVRGVSQSEIDSRVREVARLLEIEQSLDKMPRQLSGGEQQRVALGRAIVREPKVFLMDEPLSNLDAPLRVQMRTLVKKIQREIGVTTVYVTHDQAEALSLANRVGVMNQGALLQYDLPERVYSNPINSFVARFVGTYSTNLIDVTREERDGRTFLNGGGLRYPLANELANVMKARSTSKELTLAIRPEDITVDVARTSEASLEGEVTLLETLGATNLVEVRVGGTFLKVSVSSETRLDLGKHVWLDFEDGKLHVFERATGLVAL